MAQRTTTTKVQETLGSNWDGTTSVQPYIDLATVDVDNLDAQDTDNVLNAATLTNIETLLACDYYCLQAPLASTSKIGQSMESYSKRRSYWDMAKAADVSGRLGKRKGKAKWLGKRRSEETEYVDRD